MTMKLHIKTKKHRWVWNINRTLFLLSVAIEIGLFTALPIIWLLAPDYWVM